MRKFSVVLIALALLLGIAHEANAKPFLGLGLAGRGLARGLRGRGARGLVGRNLAFRGLHGGLGLGGLGANHAIFRNRGLFLNRGLIGQGIYSQAAFAAPLYQQQAILQAPVYQQQALLQQAPVCAPAMASFAQEEVIQQQAVVPGCGCGVPGAALAYPGGLLRQRGFQRGY